jgi:hypothetical protein
MSEGKMMEGNFNEMTESSGGNPEFGQYSQNGDPAYRNAQGTNKSKGGGFSLLEVKTSTALPPKAAHGRP